VYEQTVENVDVLVKQSGVLSLPQSNPNEAFAQAAINTPSVHLRIAYGDNTRWASVYNNDDVIAAITSRRLPIQLQGE